MLHKTLKLLLLYSCLLYLCNNIKGTWSSQALVGNPSRSWQLQTKTCISGYARSSYVKSASAAGAEEIIIMIQRPKRRCSSMLWSMESMTKHNRSHGHPLHPGLAVDVLTLSCLWIQLGQNERVGLTARISLTIIQFTAHVILISNIQSQQAHICKSYKSPEHYGKVWLSCQIHSNCAAVPRWYACKGSK